MDKRLQKFILIAWQTRIGAEDLNSPPAEEAALRAFEAEFGAIPAELRWFLANCGGGPVGSEWVDDIKKLPRTHCKFQAESRAGWWTLADVFIIGWDGGGNPYGIHQPTGRLLVEDHDFGGVHEMAPSFTAFLVKGLEVRI